MNFHLHYCAQFTPSPETSDSTIDVTTLSSEIDEQTSSIYEDEQTCSTNGADEYSSANDEQEYSSRKELLHENGKLNKFVDFYHFFL